MDILISSPLPAGQIVQANDSIAVVAFVNFFPAAQALQEDDDSPEYVPGPQMLQEVDDSLEYFPVPQSTQPDDSNPVAAFVNFFPAAHAVQEADDSPEYCPAGHAVQESDDTPEYSPATQSVHADDSNPVAAFINFFPAAHAVQETEDSPEYFPIPQFSQSASEFPPLSLYKPAEQENGRHEEYEYMKSPLMLP